MHGLMLSQTCMHRGYLTNKNHPTLSCEYLMQRKTKTVWGSPFSQRGPHFYQGKWGPGVPIFMGSPKFYDTGPVPTATTCTWRRTNPFVNSALGNRLATVDRLIVFTRSENTYHRRTTLPRILHVDNASASLFPHRHR